MNGKSVFRDASPKEAAQISELAIRSKAYWGYPKAFIDACREELTVTPQLIDSDELNYVVAERVSEMLGYYALQQCTEHEFELEALYVAPKYVGKGVGTTLMTHAKRTVQRVGGERLLIQSDPNAVGFYRALGAKLIGSRESGSISGRMLPLLSIALAKNT